MFSGWIQNNEKQVKKFKNLKILEIKAKQNKNEREEEFAIGAKIHK